MRNSLTLLTAMFLLLLSACQPKQELTSLDLSSMADVPETVTIVIKNYKPQTGNSYQHLFVSNFSVDVHHGMLEWSSARDGLSDQLKYDTFNIYGFYSDSSESAVPGFADFVLYKAGINLTNYPQLACSPTKMASTSNDMIIYNDDRQAGSPQQVLGLRDCEKSYLGLNPNGFDENNNGIPDYLELRCGMNPLNPNEAFVSASGDGVSNIEKCKMHLPLDADVRSQPGQLLGYRYAQSTNTDNSKDFKVSNIPIMKGGKDNMIVFYFTEVDNSTGATSLYTAYAILKDGYNGRTLQFDYWATTPANFYNQQVIVP